MSYLWQPAITSLVIQQTKMEEWQAGFTEAHQCGVLMVIAGLPFYFTWSGWRNIQWSIGPITTSKAWRCSKWQKCAAWCCGHCKISMMSQLHFNTNKIKFGQYKINAPFKVTPLIDLQLHTLYPAITGFQHCCKGCQYRNWWYTTRASKQRVECCIITQDCMMSDTTLHKHVQVTPVCHNMPPKLTYIHTHTH